MTYGILKSVNHKNKLYKNLMKINKDLPLLKNPSNTVFKFEQIDNATVVQYINKLKSSHSCGHDSISSYIIKYITKDVGP